ncbi:MAG: rRNA maturation RNase YbeY [Clostridia bacterium]|jgi:metalloprotein, YbeY family|nr:rRNA maturation RNase YbeY [Clostridia bacterium]
MKHNFRIYSESGEFPEENAKALEKAMDGFVDSDIPLAVEFIFTDEEEIRRLNRETRNTDKVTDVLSFPALDSIKGKALKKRDFPLEIDDEGNLLIGSVAVCVKRAEEQAEEYGHSYQRELHYLLVHGIMHCLGYDHLTDEERAEMREREEFILAKLGISREN